VRRDGRIRIGEALLPPGVQELAYRIGMVVGPLLPATAGEGVSGLFQSEEGICLTGDQNPGELRQERRSTAA
jgi:hypothetical protein